MNPVLPSASPRTRSSILEQSLFFSLSNGSLRFRRALPTEKFCAIIIGIGCFASLSYLYYVSSMVLRVNQCCRATEVAVSREVLSIVQN